ncbi:MAG: hypothetical protein AAF501_08565 [Pseudomonadota bacterium]
MSFVGLIEDADLIAKLSAFLGARLQMPRSNATSKRKATEDLDIKAQFSGDAVAALAERTRLDARLWSEMAEHAFEGCHAPSLADHAWIQDVCTSLEATR